MTGISGEQGLASIGIVTWNNAKDLPSCLASLEAQSYTHCQYIVVDNGSSDESLAIIQDGLPTAEVVRNPVNEGYCKAHNQAIRAARGEFYLALNPDVRLQPRYLELLVRALEARPECGSAVGKLRLPDRDPGGSRLIDSTGLFIDRRRHQYLRGHGQPDMGQYDEPGEVFGADGAAPLYRRSALEDARVSGEYLDEAFFGYQEDVDLAWRLRLLGWRAWYEAGASADHDRTFRPGKREGVPREVRRVAVKNRYLGMLKNEAPECWRRDWPLILGYDLGIFGYVLLLEQSSLGAYRLLRQQWGRALEWRRELWKRVQASPEERLGWFG